MAKANHKPCIVLPCTAVTPVCPSEWRTNPRGTGDPAPDNIRPILPWKASGETVKITRKSSPADPLLETEITLTAPQVPAGWMDNEGQRGR